MAVKDDQSKTKNTTQENFNKTIFNYEEKNFFQLVHQATNQSIMN